MAERVTAVPEAEKAQRLVTRPLRSRCAQLLGRPGFHGRYHKGHMACVRAEKRLDAYRRNGLGWKPSGPAA